MLEGNRVFGSGEKVRFAGGLVSFHRFKSIAFRLRIPAASAEWPSAAVIQVAHSLLHDLLELEGAGW